jgi:hypothetical protein
MIKVLVLQVAAALALASASISADVRSLSDAERRALLGVAARHRAVDVLDAYAETSEGKTTLRYATIIYSSEPVGSEACIATIVDYWAPGSEVAWEQRVESIAYLYWSTADDCSSRERKKAIRLESLIDSDTVARIISATPQILQLASAAASRQYTGALMALAVAYDDIGRTFLYRADYKSSEDCSGVRVHLRASRDIEFVRVVPTICETRQYLQGSR